MLGREALIQLYRDHRNDKVLSLYLDAEENNPSKRKAWRIILDHLLDRIRTEIRNDAEEARDFERGLGFLEKQLEPFDSFLPDRGWAGFATGDGLLYSESLPVRMPDLARWKLAPSVAPYVRALRQAAPVVTVLVDRRQAKLFVARQGSFDEIGLIRADTYFGDLSDNVNMSKRGTRTTGVRGESDTDAAHRFEQVGAERLLKHLVETVQEHAGSDGFVVVGGPPETTAAALQRLSKSMRDRIIEEPAIHFTTSAAELRRASEVAASTVVAQTQKRLVDQVLDLAGAGGRGCAGREATERALEERRVDLLLLSRKVVESHPDAAENLTEAAFDQDASVEEVTGPAADALDRAGGGIAARLRFTVHEAPSA